MSATTALILALRTTAKLSQSEIARRTGIPQSRISRWEAGEVPGSADDALRIARLHSELVSANDGTDASVQQQEPHDAA